MALVGKTTVEEKVRAKIVRDATQEKNASAKKRRKSRTAKLQNDLQWKSIKAEYEQGRDAVVQLLATRMMKTWNDWNVKRRSLVQSKATPDAIQATRTALYDAEATDVTKILDSFATLADKYIADANSYKPTLAQTLTRDGQVQYVKTAAQDQFQKQTAMMMSAANKLAKLKAVEQLGQFDADKVNQALSDIPIKIEEKIDMVKEILDTLLGKLTAPIFMPDSPEFDIDALLAQLKAVLNPVVSSTAPLAAVLGKIPVLGDLAGILAMLQSSSGGGQISKSDLKKLVPKKPSLDPQLETKVKAIGNDVIAFCMTLPTLLVQLILAMVNVIYSKLQIITSVIPLGNMFPLNLLPAAIAALPKILVFIKTFPSMMTDAVTGIIQDKFAEAMALAFPKPNIDSASLVALTEDIGEQNATKRAVAKKKVDYSDVTKEIYSASLKANGYTLTQAKTVQKNYLAIYNSSGGPTTKIVAFRDNGKDQSLKSGGITMADVVSFGATRNDQPDEPGFTQEEIERTAPSVEGYRKYFNYLVSRSDIKNSLRYEKIKPMKAIAGEWYESYREQLEKYGPEVVVEDEMKPQKIEYSRVFDFR